MIKRTFDYRIVRRMVDWPNIVVSREVFYLLYNGSGLFSFHKHRDGLMIHANMSDKCRGRTALDGVKEAFEWIVKNTGVKNIYAEIPEDNKVSWYMASFCGMEFEHILNNFRCYKIAL